MYRGFRYWEEEVRRQKYREVVKVGRQQNLEVIKEGSRIRYWEEEIRSQQKQGSSRRRQVVEVGKLWK